MEYDPFSPEFQADPFPAYRRMTHEDDIRRVARPRRVPVEQLRAGRGLSARMLAAVEEWELVYGGRRSRGRSRH